jgi:eukaryotic-like serine/threonine-protein kinase
MTDLPERLSTALADRYRIERELGQGGMATVYLAQDLKHDRKVALKVLRPELAAVLGAERFVVEIKTTAALQHPHILPLFDSGTADGFLYYVMPFIDGETLRDKLNRETQLGIEEAVKMTTAVAGALDYAHRQGVIHRDIKPENILLHDGRPMVADFGIALALSAAAGGRMTETGLSLGTPHYMSPEQATAEKEITGRSDIYSLASVLYEMLTGEPPHMGNSAQQIIMKIVTDTPRPVTELRKSVPAHVAAAVAQALEKLPADRFASAADFAAALEGRFGTRVAAQTAQANARVRPWRWIAMAAGVAALGCAALAAWALRGGGVRAGDGERVEFAFRLGLGVADPPQVAISADGRRILQAVQDSGGVSRLLMRELGSTALIPIPGTEGGVSPEFSPDGAWIAFLAEGKLRKVPARGGPSTVLADSVNAGAGWGLDGTILYTRSGDGLWRVPESGGTPERLTTLDTARREFNHWYPQALPGGRAAIFNSFSTPTARSRIEAVEFATGRRTVLVDGAVFARYVASGHLLYVRDGAIFAVPFDPASLSVLGAAVPVVDDVAWAQTDGVAGFAVSRKGTLVYLKASEWSVDRRVVWADRGGNERPALPEAGQWAEPRLSPNGRWIAITRLEPRRQIWLFDMSRRILTQLTRTQGVSFNALWMPDSRSIIHTTETPVYDLHRVPIDGSAPGTVVASAYDKMASSVSPDDGTVVYLENVDRDRLMLAPIAGGDPTPFEERETSQRNGAFSPDGRWLTYEEFSPNGKPEVYVRALDGQGGRRQLSADGGSQPRWTRGGREVVYRKGDAVLSVSFRPATGEVGTPALLFRKADAGRLGNGRTIGYDVTPDGSQFLMVTPIERPGAQPIVVILNWFGELKGKVPR